MNPLSALARATSMFGELQLALRRPGVAPSALSDKLAQVYGRRIALATAAGPRTYEELAVDARRAAMVLRGHGIVGGDRVLLSGEGAEAVAFALGAWRIGATLVLAHGGAARQGAAGHARPIDAGERLDEADPAPPAEVRGVSPAVVVWTDHGEGEALSWEHAHRWWTPGLHISAPEGAGILIALGLDEPEGLAATLGALGAGATVFLRGAGELEAAIAADRPKAAAVRPADVSRVAKLVAGAGGRVLIAMGRGAIDACRDAAGIEGGTRAMAAVEAVLPRMTARMWHVSLGRLGRGGLPVPF